MRPKKKYDDITDDEMLKLEVGDEWQIFHTKHWVPVSGIDLRKTVGQFRRAVLNCAGVRRPKRLHATRMSEEK